jgi:hypothetical protein
VAGQLLPSVADFRVQGQLTHVHLLYIAADPGVFNNRKGRSDLQGLCDCQKTIVNRVVSVNDAVAQVYRRFKL